MNRLRRGELRRGRGRESISAAKRFVARSGTIAKSTPDPFWKRPPEIELVTAGSRIGSQWRTRRRASQGRFIMPLWKDDEPDDADDGRWSESEREESEWEESEWEESEWDRDDDSDSDDDEEEPTIPCPYCRRLIHEDTPRCPYCERYISREDAPAARKPWWIVVGVAAALYAVFRWIHG